MIGTPPDIFLDRHLTPAEIVASLLQTPRQDKAQLNVEHHVIFMYYYQNRRDSMPRDMLEMLRSGLPEGWAVEKVSLMESTDAVYQFNQTAPNAAFGQKPEPTFFDGKCWMCRGEARANSIECESCAYDRVMSGMPPP